MLLIVKWYNMPLWHTVLMFCVKKLYAAWLSVNQSVVSDLTKLEFGVSLFLVEGLPQT